MGLSDEPNADPVGADNTAPRVRHIRRRTEEAQPFEGTATDAKRMANELGFALLGALAHKRSYSITTDWGKGWDLVYQAGSVVVSRSKTPAPAEPGDGEPLHRPGCVEEAEVPGPDGDDRDPPSGLDPQRDESPPDRDSPRFRREDPLKIHLGRRRETRSPLGGPRSVSSPDWSAFIEAAELAEHALEIALRHTRDARNEANRARLLTNRASDQRLAERGSGTEESP